jgi:hypothetical protein
MSQTDEDRLRQAANALMHVVLDMDRRTFDVNSEDWAAKVRLATALGFICGLRYTAED